MDNNLDTAEGNLAEKNEDVHGDPYVDNPDVVETEVIDDRDVATGGEMPAAAQSHEDRPQNADVVYVETPHDNNDEVVIHDKDKVAHEDHVDRVHDDHIDHVYTQEPQPVVAPVATREETVVEEDIDDRKYTGVSPMGALVGMLTAFSVFTLLTAIAALVFTGTVSEGWLDSQSFADLSVQAIALLGVLMFLAYYVGGWTAGRIGRYNGGLNGALVVVFALMIGGLLAFIAGVAGDEYNLFSSFNFPDFFDADTWSSIGILAALVALGTMLLGAVLGGQVGSLYHKRADEYLLDRYDHVEHRTWYGKRIYVTKE